MFACSSKPAMQQKVVDPNGGQVSLSDGTSVLLPQGALSAPVTITITQQPGTPPPTDVTPVGSTYLFGPEGTQFAQPVTVTLLFAPDQLPSGSGANDIVIYTAPAGSSSFAPLQTAVVDASHVKANTTHFSIFMPGVAHRPKADLGMTTLGDLGGAMDLSAPADLTGSGGDAGCTHSYTATSSTVCSMQATCNGHTYSLDCNNLCYCQVDGMLISQGFTAGQTCLSTSGGDNSWTTRCAFP
jgi:hypothetical protein